MPRKLGYLLAAALAALAATAPSAGPAASAARSATRGREPAAMLPAVSVDVTRLREIGLGPMADVIGAAVRSALAREGVTTMRPGTSVVVRLSALSLNGYAGPDGGGGDGDGGGGGGNATNTDYLEGDVLFVEPGGRVAESLHQLSALHSDSGGAYYDADFDQRRVVALANHFAGWVHRRLG